MGIRKEIKAVIREYAGCTIGQVEAINAISNIVNPPKPTKFPKIHTFGESVSERSTLSDKVEDFRKNHPDLTPNIVIVQLEDLPFPEAVKELFKKF